MPKIKAKMQPLHQLWDAAHKMGAAGTHIADVAIFGTRRAPARNAGDAPSRRSPDHSIGLHSVWEGPRKILGGAPILRRDKPA